MAVPRFDRLQQLSDCLPLIAARFEVGFKLKWHPIILAQHGQQRRDRLCWAAFRGNRISEIENLAEDCGSNYALRLSNVSPITDWPRTVYGSGRLFDAAPR